MQPIFSRHCSSFLTCVVYLIISTTSSLSAKFLCGSSFFLHHMQVGVIHQTCISLISCWIHRKECDPDRALLASKHLYHRKITLLPTAASFCFPVFTLLGRPRYSGFLGSSNSLFPYQSIDQISSYHIDYMTINTGENFFSTLFPDVSILAVFITIILIILLVKAIPIRHSFSSQKQEYPIGTDLQILDNVQFWDKITSSAKEIIPKETVSALRSILLAVEEQDGYYMGHSIRVMQIARLIAMKMGFSTDEIKKIQSAAILHDIGKVEIGFPLLQKRDKLTEAEYDIVRQHPLHSVSILKKYNVFSNLYNIILHHHEWYNGQGYPAGIKNVQIPLESRVISVADALDGMMTYRPYKNIKTVSQIIRELERLKGIQFDPKVSEAAMDLIHDDEFRRILEFPELL